jgi:hypothetical protein
MLQELDPHSNTSADVLQSLARLSDDARTRLQPDINVRTFVDGLCSANMHVDVVDVLTQLLPKSYAVAWAYECLLALAQQQPEPDPSEQAALAVTKRWLSDPSEENRRDAVILADRLGMRSAGAWLVAAAGWTSGSMLPPGQPEVPVSPALAGDAVGTALKLAAARDPLQFDERMQTFVQRALTAFAPAAA